MGCLTHLIVGRRGPGGDGAVLGWLEVLAVPRLPAGILRVRVREASRERDEIYGRGLAVIAGAPPCLPLDLRLPVAVARPAEAGAEQDGEARAQDAQEDAGRGREG